MTLDAGVRSLESPSRLGHLCDLSQAVSRAEDVSQVYDEALRALRQILRVDRAAILLADPDGRMRFKAWERLSDSYRAAVEGHCPWAADVADPQPILVPDAESGSTLAAFADALRAEGIRALAFIPLSARGRLVGRFMAYYDAPHEFTSTEVELARIVAAQIAFAIDRGRTEERLRREIAERQTAQAELARREQDLSDLFENAAVGVHLVAADGTILAANRTELRLLGYTREEYVGRHISEFHLQAGTIADMLRRLGSGETLRGFEAQLRCRDGTVRHVLIDSNVLWEGGRFVHTRCFTRDITERKRMEAERERLLASEQEARLRAEEANRLKDEFLATMSHELRTPLNAVLGWARMLSERRLDAATTAHALEVIERNARSQAQIVEDILDVSRIVTGKLRLTVGPVQLVPVLEAAIDTVRTAAEAKGIRIEASFDPRAEPVLGDPDRLQQIAWNLLSNAVKFTPAGGRIEVRLETAGDAVRFTIRDNGKGIAPEFLPHVFDRFRQGDSSTARTFGGLGLGLAIVRHLVELHGGNVSVESAGEGAGSRFCVDLPPHRVQQTRPALRPWAKAACPSAENPHLNGVKVLVVDDEEDTRTLLTLALQQCGASVAAVGTALEALQTLQKDKWDVLVSDIGLPEWDGYELIRGARALEQGRTIPAVALTAYARVEDRARALEAGYQEHIPKPVEPFELAALVARLVRLGARSSAAS